MSSPSTLEIEPLPRPPRATVRVPGSKSITNRGLVLGALSSWWGNARLDNALQSEDTEVMVEALRTLGFRVTADWGAKRIGIAALGDQGPPVIGGCPSYVPARGAHLFVANSGTTMRFLTALVALGRGDFHLDGVARMRERPIADLLAALRQLGVDASTQSDSGFPPVTVRAAGIGGGAVRLRGDTSSQFVTALLMAAPFAARAVTVTLDGPLVSVPYVLMTLHLLRLAGITIDLPATNQFQIPAPQCCRLEHLDVEPDASAASYFFGAAAITGGEVTVAGLRRDSIQGDVRLAHVLSEMGCSLVAGRTGLTLRGGPLRGVDVDMNAMSDCVMTLAAVACFAEGPTVIRNVAHIRHKETDRIAALATELRRLGASVEEQPDGLRIVPGPLRGAEVETYDDHRMAMSLALVGLRVPGVRIRNPGCVAKTYPDFFADLRRLYDSR